MTTAKVQGKDVQGTDTQKNNNKGANQTTTAVAEAKPQTKEEAMKSLEEQIQHFLGLERLVNIRRRFEAHLETVKGLEVADEDLAKFETGDGYGVRIELHDSHRREYVITNPRLVREMQSHLVGLLEGKIGEYNEQIITYGVKG